MERVVVRRASWNMAGSIHLSIGKRTIMNRVCQHVITTWTEHGCYGASRVFLQVMAMLLFLPPSGETLSLLSMMEGTKGSYCKFRWARDSPADATGKGNCPTWQEHDQTAVVISLMYGGTVMLSFRQRGSTGRIETLIDQAAQLIQIDSGYARCSFPPAWKAWHQASMRAVKLHD